MPRPGSRRDPAFERAFVAVRYFLGERAELAAPLDAASPAVEALIAELADPDRQKRAQVLASELGQVVRELEARTFR